MSHSFGATVAGFSLIFASSPALSQEGMPTLFTNVNVFDGVYETLIENANVVVIDNLIA